MSSSLKSTLNTEEDKLLACIHCGLCLEACPTYVATGDENDGPRGRLYLMRAVGEGRLPNTSKSFERHIDRCLGCRACEQVCPAGVEYGQLLEASRGELFAVADRGFTYSALRFVLRHIWLHPKRLRATFSFARFLRNSGLAALLRKTRIPGLISGQFEFGLALLEGSANRRANGFQQTHVQDRKTDNVALMFAGCVGAGLFERTNAATERVLSLNGFAVQTPNQQVCCGALHAHAGDLEGARLLARENIKAFAAPPAPIVTNAGGCGAMLTGYGHLLAGDETFAAEASKFSARVRDVSQMLMDGEIKKSEGCLNNGAITYDASCHLLYGQRAGEAPLQMLAGIRDLNFVRLEGSERCCGAAGVYNLLEPRLSRQVLQEKLKNIRDTGASTLATGNAGCQMQIAAGALLEGMKLKVCHPVELLDESYAAAGFYDQKNRDD